MAEMQATCDHQTTCHASRSSSTIARSSGPPTAKLIADGTANQTDATAETGVCIGNGRTILIGFFRWNTEVKKADPPLDGSDPRSPLSSNGRESRESWPALFGVCAA